MSGKRNSALAARAERVLELASHTDELAAELAGVRRECEALRGFFLTREEEDRMRRESEEFDAAMRSMAFYTSENLKLYQMSGWEQLLDRGDKDDAAADP